MAALPLSALRGVRLHVWILDHGGALRSLVFHPGPEALSVVDAYVVLAKGHVRALSPLSERGSPPPSTLPTVDYVVSDWEGWLAAHDTEARVDPNLACACTRCAAGDHPTGRTCLPGGHLLPAEPCAVAASAPLGPLSPARVRAAGGDELGQAQFHAVRAPPEPERPPLSARSVHRQDMELAYWDFARMPRVQPVGWAGFHCTSGAGEWAHHQSIPCNIAALEAARERLSRPRGVGDPNVWIICPTRRALREPSQPLAAALATLCVAADNSDALVCLAAPGDPSIGTSIWAHDLWEAALQSHRFSFYRIPILGPGTALGPSPRKEALGLLVSRALSPWTEPLTAQSFVHPGTPLPDAPLLPPGAVYMLGTVLQQAAARQPPPDFPPSHPGGGEGPNGICAAEPSGRRWRESHWGGGKPTWERTGRCPC